MDKQTAEAKRIVLNRYQLANACEKVDGYLLPRPHEVALSKTEDAFERGKRECLSHLRDQIAQIEALTFDQFRLRSIVHAGRDAA